MIDKEANSTRHGEKASFIIPNERWLPIYFLRRATTGMPAANTSSIHDMR